MRSTMQWGVMGALAAALASSCTLGDDGTPNFASHGGSAVTAEDDGNDDGDDRPSTTTTGGAAEADGADTTSSASAATTTTDGGATTEPPPASSSSEEDGVGETASSGETSSGSTDGTTSDGGTTSGSESSSDGGSSSSDGGGSSSDDGGPGTDYEPCNPDGTCPEAGEICLEVGAGGFCTNTCASVAQCPPTPAGTALNADCEFLLGFPDFDADYCGIIGCNFIFNDCPAGMTCTYVVMGLTVCEWV